MISRTRAKFIRDRLLTAALEQTGLEYFSEIWDLIDFVSKGDGQLINHPKTGADPYEFLTAYPNAAAAYKKAVDDWMKYRDDRRAELIGKMGIEREV